MTDQPLSQSGPMPIILWLKFGMMCHWKKSSYGIGMVQGDTDLCACPVAMPTTMGGTFML